MRKFKSFEKTAGEMAVRRMSEKAQEFYNASEPLEVYEYDGNDEEPLYAYVGAWGEKDGMTFDELEKTLEELADELTESQKEEQIIEIYENYGVLAHEKRSVFTYGVPHSQAVCADKLMVKIPNDWELYTTQTGDKAVTAPWGWNYLINEVLAGNKRPEFNAYDKNMNLKRFELEVVNVNC